MAKKKKNRRGCEYLFLFFQGAGRTPTARCFARRDSLFSTASTAHNDCRDIAVGLNHGGR